MSDADADALAVQELRRIRDEVLTDLGDSRAEQYERNAILTAWEYLTGQTRL